MFTTILSFVAGNWSNILKYGFFITVFFFVANFVRIYNENRAMITELQAESAKWQSNYLQARDTAEENRAAFERQMHEMHNLEGQLKDREFRIEKLRDQNYNQNQRIGELEAENEDIRIALNNVIPNKLWCEVFPTSSGCSNQNSGGAAQSSGNSASAVSGTGAAKK